MIFKKKGMPVLVMLMIIMLLAVSGCGGGQTATSDKSQGSSSPKSESTINLVMTHEVSATHWKNALMEKYGKLVEERSKGRVKAKVYPASQLYSDKDAVQAIGTGSVQMVWPVSVQLEQINPAYGIINMPFTINDDVMLKNKEFRTELMQLLTNEVDKEKMRVMALLRADATVYAFKDKTPKTPDEMKGLKIRITGGQASIDWLKNLGATPISMPASEMPTAIAQGTIDGVLTSSDGWAKIIGPVAKKGLLVPQMQVLTYTVLVDEKWFRGLPQDIQKIMIDAMDEVAMSQWQESMDLTKESYQELETKFQAKPYVVPENEIKEWAKRVKPALEQFSQKNPGIYQKFVELNKKHGRVWPIQ